MPKAPKAQHIFVLRYFVNSSDWNDTRVSCAISIPSIELYVVVFDLSGRWHICIIYYFCKLILKLMHAI